jgi:hypothetical protein
LTVPEDYPPFELPELPSSVDRHDVLYPRQYCLLVLEESSFEDPVYLASKITQAFNSGDIYRTRVANQLSHDSSRRMSIDELENDVTGAIHLWTSRLLGRKAVWSDWQFYYPRYRQKSYPSKTPNSELAREPSNHFSDTCSRTPTRRRPKFVEEIGGIVLASNGGLEQSEGEEGDEGDEGEAI